MRVLLQRVGEAAVRVDGEVVGEIGHGLLALVGIEAGDTPADIDWLCRKIVALRIFNDDAGLMNRSVLDIGGQILAISQSISLGVSSASMPTSTSRPCPIWPTTSPPTLTAA